ncbi:uncharacterized protein At2g02148 isoform X2 [Carica papaya]|uniref:uncharacterized protein At2g02148 isoform X2 n=1 Tax=Carica papaya TaxID=3649 RepID=UPI000B8D16C4|nr:uncharacterized protein At2g02148 isoform X2 [Carica papaya]
MISTPSILVPPIWKVSRTLIAMLLTEIAWTTTKIPVLLFKRLTGRNEVAIFARDYKFYSPRHKYRRVTSSNIPGLPTFPGSDNPSTMTSSQGFRSGSEPQNQQQNKHHLPSLSHQPQFHPIHQNHHQPIHQSQHAAHFHQNHQCGPPSHIPDIAHAHQSPTISQHMACLQPLAGGHVGGRLHVMFWDKGPTSLHANFLPSNIWIHGFETRRHV